MSGNAIIIPMMAVHHWTKCTDNNNYEDIVANLSITAATQFCHEHPSVLLPSSSSSPLTPHLHYHHLITAMCSKLSQLLVPRGLIERSEVFQFVRDTKEIAILLLFIGQSNLFLVRTFFLYPLYALWKSLPHLLVVSTNSFRESLSSCHKIIIHFARLNSHCG